METLGRWAAYFAIAGGALFTVTLVVVAFFPTSPVAYGFIVGIVLLGAALAGLYWQTRPATGRLGWASAWLSGLGTLAVVLLGLYGLATSQISLTEQNPPMTALLAIVIAASVAWLLGTSASRWP